MGLTHACPNCSVQLGLSGVMSLDIMPLKGRYISEHQLAIVVGCIESHWSVLSGHLWGVILHRLYAWYQSCRPVFKKVPIFIFIFYLFCSLVLYSYCSNFDSEKVPTWLWQVHFLGLVAALTVTHDHAFSSWRWNGSFHFFQVPKALKLSVSWEWVTPPSTHSCYFTKPCM